MYLKHNFVSKHNRVFKHNRDSQQNFVSKQIVFQNKTFLNAAFSKFNCVYKEAELH